MSAPFPKTKVAAALLGAWSPATSGGWLNESPARGQCSVTALLLNELFGGDILKTPLPVMTGKLVQLSNSLTTFARVRT